MNGEHLLRLLTFQTTSIQLTKLAIVTDGRRLSNEPINFQHRLHGFQTECSGCYPGSLRFPHFLPFSRSILHYYRHSVVRQSEVHRR